MATISSPKGTIVLTGANGGIGSAIIDNIIASNELSSWYHGIYTVRDASTTSLRVPSHHGNETTMHSHEILSLELSNLENVRKVAADINARVKSGEIPPIRALILNAGYNPLHSQEFTEDGFAMEFMANYLGHWLLVLLLLQSMDRDLGRIVVLGSKAHNLYLAVNNFAFTEGESRMVLDDSIEPIAKGTWNSHTEAPEWRSGFKRYAACKLLAVMIIPELQRRLSADPALHNISILGVDPGTVPTGISRRGIFLIRFVLFQIIYPMAARYQAWRNPTGTHHVRTPDKSARDVLAAAFDNNATLGERPKGLYLDGSELSDIADEAKDEKKRAMVWKDSVRYAQLTEGETILADWQ